MNALTDSPAQGLLALAADLRRQADVYERHALEMMRELGQGSVRKEIPPPANRADGKRGKQPGAITAKWRAVLLRLAESSCINGRPLTFDEISNAVILHTGRDMKPSEIKRQFKPYIDVGYLQQPVRDQYEFTKLGHEKLGFDPEDFTGGPFVGEEEVLDL